MVFCRGCGKEIHETAFACPHCGAPQRPAQAPDAARHAGKLIGWALAWTVVMWFGALLVSGMIAGLLSPDDASAAGKRVGESLGGLLLLVSLCVSAAMTFAGVLPGTAKPTTPPPPP
jgi:Na+-driven multidrug efflux pump